MAEKLNENLVADNGVTPDQILTGKQALDHSKPRHFQSADIPPIRELSVEEAIVAIKQMNNNLEGWNCVSIPNDTECDEQQRWNNRIEATYSMLSSDKPNPWATKIFAYYVDDVPVGIMTIENVEPPEILTLVTHPGAMGAGGSLVEQAVKQSLAWGYSNAKVTLTPMNDHSKNAYYAMGFSDIQAEDNDNLEEDKDYLELLPAKQQDKWVMNLGEWKLKNHLGKGYIHSCSKQETFQ